MKKILSLLFILILLTGCSKVTARSTVEDYLKKYKNLSSEVLVDLESIVDKENLTEEEKDKYRNILKKQYKDLSYEVVEEEYNDNLTYVTVNIEVYDLYDVMENANTYLENNLNEFLDEDGNYSSSLFMDYKLDKMQNTTKRKEYTITFTVTKEDNEYIVEDLTNEDLMKIHGIYNYD